jgi:phage baseplate assembly protein W
MAIKIKSLENIANTYTEQQYIYQDLYLDITPKKNVIAGWPSTVPAATDIEVSYDYQAISNSLTNLFNTTPGQRFLFPEYGLDLRQFLFAPISDLAARAISSKITTSIKNNEPRVQVVSVNVTPDTDNNLYRVVLTLNIPTLNTQKTFSTFNYFLKTTGQNFVLLPATNNTI